MRKLSTLILITLCIVLLPLPGVATSEGVAVSLDQIYASFGLPKNFTTALTPQTLAVNEPWLTAVQKELSEVEKEFEDNHILFQGWNQENNVCLEITAVEDTWAKEYFDIDGQTEQTQSDYKTAHLEDEIDTDYSYDDAQWEKSKKTGGFLSLEYVHRSGNDVTHRGVAKRTIRNGYTITVDLKVFGRSIKAADRNLLNKVMETWIFTQVLPMPSESASKAIYYTKAPPSETNSGKFTVKGVSYPEASVIGVLMSWTRDQEPILVETTANKKGEFTLDITLPNESTYGMSLTVETEADIYEELLVSSITYNKRQIPVSFTGDFAEAVKNSDLHLTTNESKVVLEGTSMKGAKIQLMYGGKNIKKNVGGNQSFSFDIPTKEEGTYDITIVFGTATHSERRFNFTVERVFTPSQKRALIKEEAVKPSFNTLTEKIEGYTGRYMVYTLYPISVKKANENEWLIEMAMDATKSGFKNIIYVVSDEEPGFTMESELRLYLECLGSYPDSESIIPYFRWIFAD